MKTFKMIYRSFAKPKKYFYIFMFLVGMSLSFLSFIYSYSKISYELKCSDLIYGDYTGTIIKYSSDFDQICSVLSSDPKIEYYIPFYYYKNLENDEFALYGVQNDFLNHSEYEIIEGKFPENDSEIICEPTYLYRLGYDRKSMLNAKINLYGKQYTISGLFTRNLLYIDDLGKFILLTRTDNYPNALIYKIKDSFLGYDVFQKNNLKVRNDINENEFIKRQERSEDQVVCTIIFVILIISTALVIGHSIVLIIKKHRKNIAIYNIIGISKIKVWLSLSFLINISLLIGVIIGALLYLIGINLITYIYTSILEVPKNGILKMIPFKVLIKMAIIYVGLLMLYVLIRSLIIILSTKETNAKNELKISSKLKVIKKVVCIAPHTIASRHFRISRLSNIITILTLSSVVISFNATKLFLGSSSNKFQIYEGYDYKIEPIVDFFKYCSYDFSIDDFYYLSNEEDISTEEVDTEMKKAVERYDKAIEETEKNYRKIQEEEIDDLLNIKNEDIEITPLYVWNAQIQIPAVQLSKSLKNYLAEYTDIHDEIVLKKEWIKMNVKIIGITDEEYKNICPENIVSLKKNECICFSKYTSNLRDKEQILFNVDQKIKIFQNVITVKNIKTEYLNKMITTDENIVIGVPLNTFYDLAETRLPCQILFKANNNSRSDLESHFVNKEFINITDLSESIQVEKTENLKKKIYFHANIYLFIFAIFTCFLTLYMRCIMFEKEYVTMNILGLSKIYIFSIIFKELKYIILSVVLISGFIIKFIWMYFSQFNGNSICFKFPLKEWSICCIAIILISIICTGLLVHRFERSTKNYLSLS